MSAVPAEATMRLQDAMYQTLQCAATQRDSTAVLALHGMHALARAVLRRHNQRQRMLAGAAPTRNGLTRGPTAGAIVFDPGAKRIETARLNTRIAVMDECTRILKEWPEAFRELGAELGLRRETFPGKGDLLGWMEQEVALLPSRCPRAAERPRRTAMAKLHERLTRIERERSSNWRSVLADQIVRAAMKP